MRLGTALGAVFVAYLLQECPLAAIQLHCPDSPPKFNLTVNESSKSVAVFVEPGLSVNVRPTYRIGRWCKGDAKPQVMDSSESRRSTVLSVPYMLPCLCVEVYYACNRKRGLRCPLSNSAPSDVADVWNSTKVELRTNSLVMFYKCPAAEIEVSAALCWRHGGHCTVVFDLSVVERLNGLSREFNTSAVDKHPQMCVQRSLQGSHYVTCHFEADMSSWMFHVELRRQSIFVYINSTDSAKFSAQLCKLRESTCKSMGHIHSINTKTKIAVFRLHVSLVEERPCVQVWQSEPVLHGRRILCPEYARSRYGIFVVAVLVCVITVIALGKSFYHMVKKDTTGWLYIQRPVLLVCSSEDSAHISTVCALANILQKELGATVHLSLWAQSTQSQYGTGVADVGPLPWLFGQWDSVIKAQGHVLIIWSLDAMIAYTKWRSESEIVKSSDQKDLIFHGTNKMEESATLTAKFKLKKAEHSAQRTEPCTSIAPVFKAALTCLVGALQASKPQQVAFICLHGHNSRKDIPKAFRALPCYCLPRQLSGLLQELGVRTRLSENSRFQCWTRLQGKVLCFWLARRVKRRLQTLLPSK